MRASQNLTYRKKRGQFENYSQNFRVEPSNNSAWSYREKIAVYLPDISAVIYSTTRWSNTTTSHQRAISDELMRYLKGAAQHTFYFDFNGSCNWLKSELSREQLAGYFMPSNFKNRVVELDSSLLSFLELLTDKKTALNYFNKFSEWQDEQNKANKLDEKKDRLHWRLVDFDTSYSSEKTLAKALQDYFKLHGKNFDFKLFKIFSYQAAFNVSSRRKSAILKFNSFIKANIENFFNSDDEQGRENLQAEILELESIHATKQTFNAVDSTAQAAG